MFTDEAMKKLGAQKGIYKGGVSPPPGQSVFPIFHSRALDIEVGDTTSNGDENQDTKPENQEVEEPKLSTWGAILLLAGATVFTGVTAEFLVSFSRFSLRVHV